MTLAELSLRRPVTAVMFFVSMVVIGLIAAFRLPLEQFPEVNVPFLMVQLPVPGLDAAGSRAQHHAPGRGGAGDAARHQGAELDQPRRRRRVFIQFKDWDRDIADQRQRGARPDRRDPRRAAGRPAALLRQQVLAQRPADHPHALLERPGPAQGIRPDRARGQAAASSACPAWRASRSPASPPERDRDLDRPGAPGRARHQPQRAGGASCRRSISRCPPAQINEGKRRLRVQPVGELKRLDEMRDLVLNEQGLQACPTSPQITLQAAARSATAAAAWTAARRSASTSSASSNANLVDVGAPGRGRDRADQGRAGAAGHRGTGVRRPGRERHRARSRNWSRPAPIGSLLSMLVLFFFLRHWP